MPAQKTRRCKNAGFSHRAKENPAFLCGLRARSPSAFLASQNSHRLRCDACHTIEIERSHQRTLDPVFVISRRYSRHIQAFDFTVAADSHLPGTMSTEPEALDLVAGRSTKGACVARPIFVGRVRAHGEECALVHIFHACRTSRIGALRNHLTPLTAI